MAEHTQLAPETVLEFWFGSAELTFDTPQEERKRWFTRSDEFDQQLSHRFGPALDQAQSGELDNWRDSLQGELALIILCDQMSRNIHRNSKQAFAGDALALDIAQSVVARQQERDLGLHQRAFLGLPFEHSEDPEMQRQSIDFYQRLRDDFASHDNAAEAAQGYYRFAVAHKEVIDRFGRYPHRNSVLGRPSTNEESDWLSAGGGF